jgi:hypothetical protein
LLLVAPPLLKQSQGGNVGNNSGKHITAVIDILIYVVPDRTFDA